VWAAYVLAAVLRVVRAHPRRGLLLHPDVRVSQALCRQSCVAGTGWCFLNCLNWLWVAVPQVTMLASAPAISELICGVDRSHAAGTASCPPTESASTACEPAVFILELVHID
jgi:hypothetical protein